MKKEIQLVGDAGNVFLGGMSMGMAVVMWVIFHYLASATGKRKALGGVLGFSGWFPFARQAEKFLSTAGVGSAEIRRLITSVLGKLYLSRVKIEIPYHQRVSLFVFSTGQTMHFSLLNLVDRRLGSCRRRACLLNGMGILERRIRALGQRVGGV